jgi:hypothetical protein
VGPRNRALKVFDQGPNFKKIDYTFDYGQAQKVCRYLNLRAKGKL